MCEAEKRTPRELVLQAVEDMTLDLVVYNRRFDSSLTSELFYRTVGLDMPVEEVVQAFDRELRQRLREGRE